MILWDLEANGNFLSVCVLKQEHWTVSFGRCFSAEGCVAQCCRVTGARSLCVYWLVFSGRLGVLKNRFIAPEDSKVGEHTFVALVLTYNVLTGRKEETLGMVTEDCNLFLRAWRSKFRELFNSGKIGFSFTVHTQVWPCMDVSTWVSWKCMWGVCVCGMWV